MLKSIDYTLLSAQEGYRVYPEDVQSRRDARRLGAFWAAAAAQAMRTRNLAGATVAELRTWLAPAGGVAYEPLGESLTLASSRAPAVLLREAERRDRPCVVRLALWLWHLLRPLHPPDDSEIVLMSKPVAVSPPPGVLCPEVALADDLSARFPLSTGSEPARARAERVMLRKIGWITITNKDVAEVAGEPRPRRVQLAGAIEPGSHLARQSRTVQTGTVRLMSLHRSLSELRERYVAAARAIGAAKRQGAQKNRFLHLLRFIKSIDAQRFALEGRLVALDEAAAARDAVGAVRAAAAAQRSIVVPPSDVAQLVDELADLTADVREVSRIVGESSAADAELDAEIDALAAELGLDSTELPPQRRAPPAADVACK